MDALSGLWFALLSNAVAAPIATLRAPDATPGDITWLELADPDGPLNPTTLTIFGAQVLPGVQSTPGGLVVPIEIEAGTTALTVVLGATRLILPLAPAAESQVVLPPRLVALAGRGPATLTIEGPIAQRPDDLRVGFAEGEILAVHVDREQQRIRVEWQPGPAPFARTVPVLVADAAHPGHLPARTTVQVRARPTIPITTQPGVAVTATVGGRTHGPFVAGASGQAEVTVEVRPGEQLAKLDLLDPEGGQSTTTLSLAGDPRPGLAAVWDGRAAGGPAAPSVLISAVRDDGRPWRGEPPRCTSSLGAALHLTPLAEGLWRASPGLPAVEGPEYVRVDCDLALRAQATVRLPTLARRPAAVHLIASPPQLSSAAPRAVVRAWLESAGGDRLPPDSIELDADLGSIVDVGTADSVLRATFDGTAAVPVETAHLSARHQGIPGIGRARELRLRCTADDQGASIWATVADERGRVLPGAPLQLNVGATTLDAAADAKGAVATKLPGILAGTVVTASSAAAPAVRTLCVPGPPEAPPTIDAHLTLPITQGQVREVFLTTTPRVLELSPDATARVSLRLVDGGGNPVTTEDVDVTASTGTVGELRQRPDGSLNAVFVPDPTAGLVPVVITARSPQGSFATTSTELELAPAGTRWWPGIQLGYLTGLSGASSPYVGLNLGYALESLDDRVHIRGSVAGYRLQASVPDPDAQQAVQLRLSALTVGLGADLRAERFRFATWTGASLVLAPTRLQVTYGTTDTVDGLSLSPPGVELRIGGGWALRSGELTAELGWLFLSAGTSDLGWQGSLGGLLATVGYRARL